MLPDWVFRIGWGMPIARDYLQLRMEATQLKISMPAARDMRQELLKAIPSSHKKYGEPLRWAIKTSVPGDESGKSWGDLYFAQEIANSLNSLGHVARVDTRDKVINTESASDDIVLVIRGVERIRPQQGALNLLWVISHPSRISNHELESFDAVFAASTKWATNKTKKSGISITPLLQATNPKKFNPDISAADSGDDLLFIGNSRHEFRQIIKDALSEGLRPTIYGRDWEQFISPDFIKSSFVPNNEIAAKYRSAGIVLNDHWSDMATNGFYSNRLFDAVASGARVISDEIDGVEDLFAGAVKTYKDAQDLGRLASKDFRKSWGTEDEIVERAKRIGAKHSFDERAKVLIETVNQLVSKK